MTVRWSRRAVRDLEDIFDYIACDDPSATTTWVGRLQARARAAATVPRAGRVVPELGDEDIREVFLQSYRIVYRVHADQIHVLTVFEGHRLMRGIGTGDDET